MTAYILFHFIGLMTAGVANAVPVEGFESLFLIGRGTPTVTASLAQDQIQSAWLDQDYQRTRLQISSPLFDGPFFLTGGFQIQTSSNPSDRSAAFLKTDWRFAEASQLSVKYTYSAWNYLSSSRDLLTFEYSSFFPFGKMSGVYLSVGYFHRWLRQSWDKNWAQPLNLDTEDHMGFISLLIGWQWEFGTDNYWTIDINNREPFDHHNLDHAAIDSTVNIGIGDALFLNLVAGMR
ncbi:MAG: hypothetical protein K2X47_00590, partial [Bdellovibrionales bacterium]|nr:hypothetical protein [Bdellovibrionales bacterium]